MLHLHFKTESQCDVTRDSNEDTLSWTEARLLLRRPQRFPRGTASASDSPAWPETPPSLLQHNILIPLHHVLQIEPASEVLRALYSFCLEGHYFAQLPPLSPQVTLSNPRLSPPSREARQANTSLLGVTHRGSGASLMRARAVYAHSAMSLRGDVQSLHTGR